MKQILIAIALIGVVVSGCSKKGGGGAVVNSYYKSDSKCYERSTNNQVDSDKCDGVLFYFSTSGTCRTKADGKKTDIANCLALVDQYYIVNANCYDKNDDNKQVDDVKCTDNDDDDDDINDDDVDDDDIQYNCNGIYFDPNFGSNGGYFECKKSKPNAYKRDCLGYKMYNTSTDKLTLCK